MIWGGFARAGVDGRDKRDRDAGAEPSFVDQQPNGYYKSQQFIAEKQKSS
jgi:hypothetical protein